MNWLRLCQVGSFYAKSAVRYTSSNSRLNNFLPLLHNLHWYRFNLVTRFYTTLPKELTIDHPNVVKYLTILAEELRRIEECVTQQEYAAEDSREISITVNRLAQIVHLFSQVSELKREARGLELLYKEMSNSQEDKEMAELASEDQKQCERQIEELQNAMFDLIVPSEMVDTDEVIMEFNAGVGGQEAMLFNKDLFEMYYNYTNNRRWTCSVVEYQAAEGGGLRHGSLNITGPRAGKMLKFEGGVHRVQRVPKTERSGRIHTSTATVAVLPMPTEVETELDPKDVIEKTKRSSGPGGQNVNKRESAVQMLHVPTGIMVDSQGERSQQQNRAIALKILTAKVYQLKVNEQFEKLNSTRKLQVGSALRSDKIRTYNFPQDRITDHRLPCTLHGVEEFLEGGAILQSLITDLSMAARNERLIELFAKAAETQSISKAGKDP